ncbi:MAG: hypothetical protein KIS66_08400 [Fimbriimonadaceae bacterium]|nr:hypothetical protein [Fimbriimonadaceae bacterium]
MDGRTRNTLRATGVVAGLVSIPLPWWIETYTVTHPRGPLDQFLSFFASEGWTVTGLNGSVRLFVQTPLWFLAFVGVFAIGLQWLALAPAFAASVRVQRTVAVVALVWVTAPVATILGRGSIESGWLFALYASLVAVVCSMGRRPATSP